MKRRLNQRKVKVLRCLWSFSPSSCSPSADLLITCCEAGPFVTNLVSGRTFNPFLRHFFIFFLYSLVFAFYCHHHKSISQTFEVFSVRILILINIRLSAFPPLIYHRVRSSKVALDSHSMSAVTHKLNLKAGLKHGRDN